MSRGSSIHPMEEKTEADNVTSVELNRRILYFSDGTMEDASDSDNEVDAAMNKIDSSIDESTLPFGPLLKYKAYKLGSSILSGIDYIGGGLASFLGITTSKYGFEIENHQRELNRLEHNQQEDNRTWTGAASDQRNNNLNEVITRGPRLS